jgi:hypothetical protein
VYPNAVVEKFLGDGPPLQGFGATQSASEVYPEEFQGFRGWNTISAIGNKTAR